MKFNDSTIKYAPNTEITFETNLAFIAPPKTGWALRFFTGIKKAKKHKKSVINMSSSKHIEALKPTRVIATLNCIIL